MDFTALPPFADPHTLEALRVQEEKARRFAYSYTAWLEAELVKHLELHLGRVPSNEEMAQHGECIIGPDGGRAFQWDGVTFLTVEPIFKATPPAHFS